MTYLFILAPLNCKVSTAPVMEIIVYFLLVFVQFQPWNFDVFDLTHQTTGPAY